MPDRDSLIQEILAYNPNADVDLLRRAWDFMEHAHRGQYRRSGEPFVRHPIEVARILARMRMDVPTIVAGLLHDTVEDGGTSLEEIQRRFGTDVAALVDGLTKIGRAQFRSLEERQAENFRKMLLSISRDLRVILIKLADRLHNMRTLQFLSRSKQKEIAQETLDIYAPLANRLGIGWMKTELEDLCFRYLRPDLYGDLEQKVAQSREERETYISEVIRVVEAHLREHGFQARVFGRTKHLYGIYQKMQRRGIPFEEVYDVMGIRIITDTRVNCYAILGLIHSLWTPVPGRFKDYIGVPKSNLYQSLHTTVVGPKGIRVEFQIRTEEMHRIAEEGIAAHWRYKDRGILDEQDSRIYQWLRQLLEWQQEVLDNRQFMDSLKRDLFPDTIYVFTPRGDVKELVRGSTPVDFAYAIHTEIGHHCVGAKVNGKMVPLRHPLKTGDTVEILTNPNHRPSRDWLKFVRTSRARAKIKQFLRQEERRSSLELGRKILERELVRHHRTLSDLQTHPRLEEAMRQLGCRTWEDLLVGLGYGKYGGRQFLKALEPKWFPEETTARRKPRQRTVGGVPIQGAEDFLVHFSRCCNPVPGDRIIGYITRGRGITIHTLDCPNLDSMDYDQDRLIDVQWAKGSSETTYPLHILVYTQDRPGMLASVSSAITSTQNTNIRHAEVSTTEDQKAILDFEVEIRNLRHLEQLLQKIRKVEGVLSVERQGHKKIQTI